MRRFLRPQPVTRQQAIDTFEGGDAAKICDTLVAVAFYDPDWRWVQDQCIRLLQHPQTDVRALAATCLGHVARIHRRLDLDRVLPLLQEAALNKSDPQVAGTASDALDDIEQFIAPKTSPGE